jgi:4-hydroxybenzoate polyprenyltransferase
VAVGIVRIVRLRTTFSAPVLTLIGWIDVGQQAHPATRDIACSLLSSFTLIAFSQIFNDIVDRDLDAEAKPERPIPAGVITVAQARAMALALALASIGAAMMTSVATLCYAVFCLALSVLYSARLKNTILLGNLTVAVVSCAMLSYGSSTVSSPWGRELAGTIAIFLYTLGNELYKTAADSREDAQYGLRTIATVYGLCVTARTVAMVTGALLALIVVAGITRFAPIWFVLEEAVVIGVPVVCGAVTANTPREVTVETFARSHVFWRLAWVPGTLAMLLLR